MWMRWSGLGAASIRLDKQECARRAENWLVTAGARIGAHPDFGRADLVATKPGTTSSGCSRPNSTT